MLAGLAAALSVTAFGLNDERRLSYGERASILQALAAAGSLAATAVLVGVTGYYAWVTGEMLVWGQPTVDVELKQAWIDATGSALLYPLMQGRMASSQAPGYTRFMYAVEVRNAGGSAATVSRAGVVVPGAIDAWLGAPTFGPDCLIGSRRNRP
jgi:hypothetical protein